MSPQRRVRLITFLLFVSVAFLPAHAQDAPLNGFDDYVNKALREWEVPGLAIAIIKDDRIVLAKGYGLRKLGDPAPVNERTLFAIGSPRRHSPPLRSQCLSMKASSSGMTRRRNIFRT